MTHTHVTAPTQFVEMNGIRFAYRRFGKETGVPLLFMQHFRGWMHHWDLTVTDGFASGRARDPLQQRQRRQLQRGDANNINAMGDYAAGFAGALGLSQIDVLGFSIGGFIAAAFTLRHQSLVRRLMLVDTRPCAGQPTQDPKVKQHAETPDSSFDDFLYVFFAPWASSLAAYSECTVDYLSRFWPRIAVSISGIIPVSCTHVSRLTGTQGKTMTFFCCNAHRSDLPQPCVTCITCRSDCPIDPKSNKRNHQVGITSSIKIGSLDFLSLAI